jgi:hypothetical protein
MGPDTKYVNRDITMSWLRGDIIMPSGLKG